MAVGEERYTAGRLRRSFRNRPGEFDQGLGNPAGEVCRGTGGAERGGKR